MTTHRLHNLEAEQSVIGALLLDPLSSDRIGTLKPAHFYDAANRLIFTEILRMIGAGLSVDVVTVAEELMESGHEKQTGGLAYLGELVSNTPGSKAIAGYASKVIGKAIERQLLAASESIRDTVTGAGSTKEKIASAQAAVMGITEAMTTNATRSLRDVLLSAAEVIEQRSQGIVNCLPTGFCDLDRQLGGGLRPGNLILVAGRPSMGKAQPIDAKVLLVNGQWSRMGDLVVGDALASVDGEPSVVTGVFPQGLKQTLRVTFTDGRSTECCAEHLWSVSHRKWNTPKVMSTTDVVAHMARPGMQGRLWVESISGDFGSQTELPVDPWLLGALLGDGDMTSHTLRFSKTASETVERVRSALPESVEMVSAGGCDYRLSVPHSGGATNPLMESIRALGLAGCSSADKFIPYIYLSASRSVRLNLLRGLLDTDGWVEKTGSVLYSTSSPRLAHDVQTLARSLGYWCTINVSQPHYTYKGQRLQGLDHNRLTISGGDIQDLFLCEAKRTRCTQRIRNKRIAFDSIVPSREDDCLCIAVSHPSRLYVTDDYIVTHNTALAVNIAMQAAREKHSTLFLSMEMTEQEISDRLIAQAGSVYLSDVIAGNMEGDPGERIMAAMSRLVDCSLHIDTQGGLTYFDVASKARSTKRQHGLDLLVIDYLQLMSGTGDNRNSQIEVITRSMKALAKELNVPIILLSQLSRDCDKRPNKRPMLSDLRDSGSIEQDADIVMFVYRDELYNTESPDKGTGEIIVGKNRQGKTGMVRMLFEGCYSRFVDLPGHWMPQEQHRNAPYAVKRKGLSVA